MRLGIRRMASLERWRWRTEAFLLHGTKTTCDDQPRCPGRLHLIEPGCSLQDDCADLDLFYLGQVDLTLVAWVQIGQILPSTQDPQHHSGLVPWSADFKAKMEHVTIRCSCILSQPRSSVAF